MIQVVLGNLLGKFIAKKGGIHVLLFVGDLIVKTTKSKKDDELWSKIKPIIKKYK
jgi:hypothetical protein